MLGRIAGLLFILHVCFGLDPVIVENEAVRVTVDSPQGAVTSLVYKRAISFPYIADKGAGIAATGSLFAPVVWNGDRKIEIPLALRSRTQHSITLAGATSGIALTRAIRLDERSFSIAIYDARRNSTIAAGSVC